jgi:hypothetical protein
MKYCNFAEKYPKMHDFRTETQTSTAEAPDEVGLWMGGRLWFKGSNHVRCLIMQVSYWEQTIVHIFIAENYE